MDEEQKDEQTVGYVADFPECKNGEWYSVNVSHQKVVDIELMRMLLRLTKKCDYNIRNAAEAALIRMCNAVCPVK